jgi:hypothetical protein
MLRGSPVDACSQRYRNTCETKEWAGVSNSRRDAISELLVVSTVNVAGEENEFAAGGVFEE